MKIDLRMSDEDRKCVGGPEWLTLDTDWARDQPAEYLMRWEAECGYPIDRALAEIGNTMPARATLVLLWLARKQGGLDAGGRDDDGNPTPFSDLAEVKVMRVSARMTPKVGDDG